MIAPRSERTRNLTKWKCLAWNCRVWWRSPPTPSVSSVSPSTRFWMAYSEGSASLHVTSADVDSGEVAVEKEVDASTHLVLTIKATMVSSVSEVNLDSE